MLRDEPVQNCGHFNFSPSNGRGGGHLGFCIFLWPHQDCNVNKFLGTKPPLSSVPVPDDIYVFASMKIPVLFFVPQNGGSKLILEGPPIILHYTSGLM